MLKDDLNDFVGGMGLSSALKRFFKANSEVISEKLYRGLPYPKHLIEEGEIIGEWHSCSHWSYNEGIALDFAKSDPDEFYYDEMAEELELEGKKVKFVPLILYCRDLIGCDISFIALENGLDEDYFGAEEEVVVVGEEFEIKSIHTEKKRGKTIYYAEVEVI